MADLCFRKIYDCSSNVPPWVAGHPATPDTFTQIHSLSTTRADIHLNHSYYRSEVLCLQCMTCAGRSFAESTFPVVHLSLLSLDTPASIAAQKRSIVCVRLKVGPLDALLRENHGTSIFVPLGDVDEKPDIEICARLVFLHDWLSGLPTGICVDIDRYRAKSALRPNRSSPPGTARLPAIRQS